MITIINPPGIYSCYLKKLWINLADIRMLEYNPELTQLTITWRNGDASIVSGEDAFSIMHEWKSASRSSNKLDDQAYFLMDKIDYSLQVLALGVAIQGLIRVSKHNPDFNRLGVEDWLEDIRQAVEREAQKVGQLDISATYLSDRDTPVNKIHASIVEVGSKENFLRVF